MSFKQTTISAAFIRLNSHSSRAKLLFLLTALFLIHGCGKRGAPVPPRERVTQIAEIAGFQRGNQVILSWQMPARNASKSSTLNISRADIYRLAEPANAPLQISEEEFANRSTLIAAMPITDADFALKTITYRDQLQFAGQAARLRYAIRFVNSSGQKAGFSNNLIIEPTSKIAANPSDLVAEATQDAVKLKWTSPTANVDGSTPVSLLGFYVYRSNSQTEPAKMLNKAPITATSFDDEFFEFGKEYFYFVRAVSIGTQVEPVESSESNIVKFRPVDIFRPTPPTAITVAASATAISIFFAVNPEKDIAGYRIYRTTNESESKEKWQLLTTELLKTNTFQDNRVESGKKYFYYITAIDNFKNVSEPSEVISETVP